MQHYRLQHLVGRIHDVDALHGAVASIDVIKLQVLYVGFQLAQLIGVIASKVDHSVHHLSTHSKHERLFVGIAEESNLLDERAHLLGIECCPDHKRIARCYVSLRKLHLCASATLAHLADAQSLVAGVLQREFCRYGISEQHLSTVDCLLLRGYFLRRCRNRQQRYQHPYTHSFHLFTLYLSVRIFCFLFYFRNSKSQGVKTSLLHIQPISLCPSAKLRTVGTLRRTGSCLIFALAVDVILHLHHVPSF